MKYLTSLQMAEKWGITKRRVNSLCKEGLIHGAYKEGYRWMIPENAVKPGNHAPAYYFAEESGKWETGKNITALPIGISDYKTAVSRYYYVDKTLLIKDLLDYRPLVSLFTRPRRFGKSLNMDMLRVFFEISEEDTSVYFKNTNIWKAGAVYRREQGKYPVIFLTFKDIKYDNWQDAFLNLKAVIQTEYKRHLYLEDSEKLSEMDKNLFYRVLTGELEDALWPGTLANLCYFLHEHYDKAPMIMIDEYDTPIQQGHLKGYYQDVIAFMRNFLSGGLKDNHSLSMAFLTGILRVAKESIFSGLNNLHVNSILENRYSRYFGFTREEVKQLLGKFGRMDKMEEMERWYDGYHFGWNEIFNPWSVLNYLDGGCFPKTFWQSTGSNEIIGEVIESATPEILEELQSIMNGNTVGAYIDTSVVYPEIQENPSSIYSFLLMAGYLTVRDVQQLHDGNSYCQVGIPNREISMVYEKEILSKLRKIVPTSSAIAIQQALYMGDEEKLQQELQKFLLNTVSSHDVAQESFYHGLLLGMSAVFNNYYYVTSNREEGYGRYDIQLCPIHSTMRGTLPGFVLELKAAAREIPREDSVGEVLEKLAKEALEQIDRKAYCVGLREHGCRKVIKIGIAFYGKKCRAAVEME